MKNTCIGGHPREQYGYMSVKGHVRCRECRRLREQRRQRSKRPDGLEKEYGKVPEKDPQLVDWVVLWRTFKEGRPPRRLTPGETVQLSKWGMTRNTDTSNYSTSWGYRHYGGQPANIGVDERIFSGGSYVPDIEDKILSLLWETV